MKVEIELKKVKTTVIVMTYSKSRGEGVIIYIQSELCYMNKQGEKTNKPESLWENKQKAKEFLNSYIPGENSMKKKKFSDEVCNARFKKVIDKEMLNSIDNYFSYGFDPGACLAKLVKGDYMGAWFKAHRLIQEHDVWLNYYELGLAIQEYKKKMNR